MRALVRVLRFVKVSAKTGEGLDHLTSVIQSVCLKEELEATPSVLVTRLRHKASLEQAHRSLEEAMRSLERKESGECVALDIRAALDALGRNNRRGQYRGHSGPDFPGFLYREVIIRNKYSCQLSVTS